MAMLGGLIAWRAKEPRLALDEEESTQIGQSLARALSYHNIPLSPAAQAWVGCAMIVGGIYSAKIAAIRMMREADKQKEPTDVVPLNRSA